MPTDWADATPLVSLTVAYSWACNFDCAHCALPPTGPGHGELTSLELKEWLGSLPETLCWVCFTGGEPTVDPDRLVAGVTACTARRIPSTMVTNGQWIQARRGELLKTRLWQAGMRAFAISYDEYHEPFWSLDRVKQGVADAAAFGFDITVKLVESANYRDSLREEFLAAGANAVAVQALTPIGRGRLLPVLASPGAKLSSCAELLSPMLTPNGDVYACCSSRDLGPGSSHFLGNARERSLVEILEARQRDALLIAETVLGPGGFADLLGETPFGEICGLCHEIMSDPTRVQALRERIQEPRTKRKILGRHLLTQASEDREHLLLPLVYEAWNRHAS